MRTRFLLLVLFIFSLSSPAQAQIPSVAKSMLPTFDLGIKAGANFANISGKTWESEYNVSYLAGIFLGVRAAKFGVQAEAFFSQESYTTTGLSGLGSSFAGNVKDSVKHGSFRLNYLNIPILFQVKLLPMLWLQVGPQYSGVVSVKDVDGLTNDAKSLFKSGSVSAVGGLELKLPLHLNAGVRYVLALSSINNTDVSGAWQQRTLQVHVGYRFL